MSSKTKILPNPLTKVRRRTKRSVDSRRRFLRRPCQFGAPKPVNNGEATSSVCRSSDVSVKLEALESLIPAQTDGEARKTEQLFKETADYIVLLKTRVVILQKLVDFFGSSCSDRENAVVS